LVKSTPSNFFKTLEKGTSRSGFLTVVDIDQSNFSAISTFPSIYLPQINIKKYYYLRPTRTIRFSVQKNEQSRKIVVIG
jgi:hypothetical protein